MTRKEEIVQAAIKEFPRFAERRVGFIAGAEWAINHFVAEQLEACKAQTKAEANRERQFVMEFLRDNSRPPTFSDCIEATRKQMIDKACEWLEQHDAVGDWSYSNFRKAMEE